MATYASLTDEQKTLIQSYVTLVRSWTGEQARGNNHAQAIHDAYNAFALTILNLLDAGEVIPNSSGLDGAVSLTKDEVTTLSSHVENILSNMSSHTAGFDTPALRQIWTKAAGAAHMIG